MRVAVIRDKNIHNIILNEAIDGNYWITETDENGIERNLISIEADNGKWKLISNKNVYYVENGFMRDYVYLEENKFYLLHNEKSGMNFLIYCSPFITNYSYYEISSIINDNIYIGGTGDCIVNCNYLNEKSCYIKKSGNNIFVVDNNSKHGVYVNNARVKKYKEIKNGDVIFILGLKIIYVVIKDNHNTLISYLGVNNIDNSSVSVMLVSSSISTPLSNTYTDEDDENEYPLYDENEYFYKIPRFVRQVKTLDLQIDAPPAKQEDQEMPFLLTVAPMLTMSLTSVITLYSSMSGVINGNATWGSAMPSIVMGVTMMLSMLLWPTITRKYQKRLKKKREKERQEKYGKYIEEKRQEIIEAKKEQTEILIENCPTIEQVIKIIATRDISLWQRRIKDPDYLKINLGTGTYEMDININYPEEHFSMTEDNLRKMVETLGSEPKLLENVPFEFSFVENYISGLIGEEQNIAEYMRRLLLQILTFHSYDDLKIIIFTDEESQYKWKYLRTSPHLFSDDKKVRFFAANSDEHKELSYYLDKILITRLENSKQNVEISSFNQTYLIITDCFKKIRDLDFIKYILDAEKNLGFSLFILDNKMIHLPDQCSSYIELNGNDGKFYNNQDFDGITEFKVNLDNEINYDDCIYRLANIPIEIENEEEGHIPDKLGFLEMYKAGKIEHLNIMNRWKLNDPTKSLRAELGINKQESEIYLDLHEKYHGPHGLIAGTTGSGKSELIITYILSMAVNYSPEEVAFILIDYKGGGLAGAFENKKNNIRLPHLAGTITNLDKNEMNRTLVSIQSELTRRQQKFNEVKDMLEESTLDIYKYQKFYREGKIAEPMPHLFIICDEFAELKQQQPDFMNNLISAARIGRSLGVHLILATQKPSGVVNDQIWSNTKFRICLKVASPGDSNEVIKCPDAANIKNAGRFYLQVGQNEIFMLGQSGYCGINYVPSEIVQKDVDKSVQFIDNLGNIIKNMDNVVQVKQVSNLGDELSNILKYIINLASKLNVKAENLWLDAIPNEIYLNDIIDKYNYHQSMLTAIIGEYDDPSNQKQGILAIPIEQESNTVIYGLSGNNREMFIRTFIYSLCKNYSSEQVNFYILDFGSESLKIFSKLPHVGDVVIQSETDKIEKLFKLINEELLDRKKKFADYNGDYNNYCKNSGQKIPKIIFIINNLEAFKEMYINYDEILLVFAREGSRYGINLVITNSSMSGVLSRFLKNFYYSFVLDMNSKDDYMGILGRFGNVYPADYPGRGLFRDDNIYEYQVAKICDDDEIVDFIKKEGERLSKTNKSARCVPSLPEIVKLEDVESDISNLKQVPVGIVKDTLDVYKYNFKADKATVISANSINICKEFAANLMLLFKKIGNVISVVLDFSSDFESIKQYSNSYCKNDFDTFFNQILEYYDKNIETTDYNMVFFVVGVEKFGSSVDEKIRNKFMEYVKKYDNFILLYLDEANEFKKMAFEAWFTGVIQNQNGIWLGTGAGAQSIIKTSDFDKKYNAKISSDFAWIFKNGDGVLTKVINEIKSKQEEGE